MDVKHVHTGEHFVVLGEYLGEGVSGTWLGHVMEADGCLKVIDSTGEVRWIKATKLELAGP
jgi:hypothetical protein